MARCLQVPRTDVLADIRAKQKDDQVHVVIVTAQSGEAPDLHGLDLGADNYLVKPVSAARMVARVEVHLKRGAPRSLDVGHGPYRYRSLTINLNEGNAIRQGRRVSFGALEQRILARLL